MSTISPIRSKDYRIVNFLRFCDTNDLTDWLNTVLAADVQNVSERILLRNQFNDIFTNCLDCFKIFYNRYGYTDVKPPTHLNSFHTIMCFVDIQNAHYFKQMDSLFQSKATDKQSSSNSNDSHSGISQQSDKVSGNNNAFKAFQESVPAIIHLIRTATNIESVVKRFGFKLGTGKLLEVKYHGEDVYTSITENQNDNDDISDIIELQ